MRRDLESALAERLPEAGPRAAGPEETRLAAEDALRARRVDAPRVPLEPPAIPAGAGQRRRCGGVSARGRVCPRPMSSPRCAASCRRGVAGEAGLRARTVQAEDAPWPRGCCSSSARPPRCVSCGPSWTRWARRLRPSGRDVSAPRPRRHRCAPRSEVNASVRATRSTRSRRCGGPCCPREARRQSRETRRRPTEGRRRATSHPPPPRAAVDGHSRTPQRRARAAARGQRASGPGRAGGPGGPGGPGGAGLRRPGARSRGTRGAGRVRGARRSTPRFRRLASADAARAGRLLLDLLGAQHAAYPHPVAYDIVLGPGHGCVQVTVGPDGAEVRCEGAARAREQVDFQVIGDPARLARLFTASPLRGSAAAPSAWPACGAGGDGLAAVARLCSRCRSTSVRCGPRACARSPRRCWGSSRR